MPPAIDIFRKQTFKMLPDIVLVPSKALKNMFFIFRIWSLNTLTIASCRALALFELPSEIRHKNLSHRVFVTELTYFINILSSGVSDMLVDSSAPRVNSLGKDSSMAVLVSICLLIANCNSSNVATDKYVAFRFIVCKWYFRSLFFKIFSNKTGQFFIVASGSPVFSCHKINAFCQLFNDPSILQAFCFVLISFTFSDLSPYSSFPVSFSFLGQFYYVKVSFMSSRVFVILERWYSFVIFHKLWGFVIQRTYSDCSPAVLHMEQ